MDLDYKHPDWMVTEPARVKSRALYEGTETVRAASTDYLLQGKNEEDEDYALRLSRAVLDPYVEKIITARMAVLFDKMPMRTPEPFLDNVDGRGTSADEFFTSVARNAQIDGIAWVLADFTRAPAEGVRTRLDEIRAGQRPFFHELSASQVIDWSTGTDGTLDWVVFKVAGPDTRTGPGAEYSAVDQWHVWTRTTWTIYEQTGDTAKFMPVDDGTNSLGVIPIVPFYGIKHTEWSGYPVARSVLDHVIQIYNMESDRDWFEYLSAHPIPIIIAPEKPEKFDANGGIYLSSSSAQGVPLSVQYLEPSGSASTVLRNSIDAVVAKVYAIALAQAKQDSAQVQSADGQREDRKIFVSSLRTTAVAYERAENQCWQYFAAWTGATPVQVEYARNFDDRLIDDTMLTVLSDSVAAALITKETYLETLKRAGVLLQEFDIQEELRRLADTDAAQTAQMVRLLNDSNSPPAAG